MIKFLSFFFFDCFSITTKERDKDNPADIIVLKFLEMLIKSPGQAFSKEELTEYALGRKYTAYDRSIDVHISNLRNKLGNDASGEPIVKTVRGFGYLFNA